MTDWIPEENNDIFSELNTLDPEIVQLARPRDGTATMLAKLFEKYPKDAINECGADRVWELAGLLYFREGRHYEALGIFLDLYRQQLNGQEFSGTRVHKGMPLTRISDTFSVLGFPVHAMRYLMLALCEDAITGKGDVSPNTTGAYFRLVWYLGLPAAELERYVAEFWKLSDEGAALYPEALLQSVDTHWMTSVPSQREAFYYVVNGHYVRSLIDSLGQGAGRTLENLASYLLSCMPGCRTRKRSRSWSTDYDVVCTMEGFDLDFRSELGRYFVCECKDWETPANYSTMAKFCRVLDSTKARFGILFTKKGITGAKRTTDAAREQMKIYQDRGIVIVTIDRDDLGSIASGGNLISFLRDRYETVRLDLRGQPKTTTS